MTAPAGGLQVFFRGDANLLYRMLAAANLDRAFVAAVMNVCVIETITKALGGPFQKQGFGDSCSHGANLWLVP